MTHSPLFNTAGNKGGKQPGDIFDDLLGSQGYQFPKRETGPRTINEMRKEELAKDMDPDKLKVSQNKDNNMPVKNYVLHAK